MKKSKFLLLGSVASMAAIPFVAAKCGGTKENKKPAEMPGGTEQPGKPGDTDQPAQPNPGTTPSTPAKPGKTPERMAQDTDVSGADISGSIKTPDTTATKTKLSDALKTIANNNLGKVQVSKEDKDKKEKVEEAIKTALVAKVTERDANETDASGYDIGRVYSSIDDGQSVSDILDDEAKKDYKKEIDAEYENIKKMINDVLKSDSENKNKVLDEFKKLKTLLNYMFHNAKTFKDLDKIFTYLEKVGAEGKKNKTAKSIVFITFKKIDRIDAIYFIFKFLLQKINFFSNILSWIKDTIFFAILIYYLLNLYNLIKNGNYFCLLKCKWKSMKGKFKTWKRKQKILTSLSLSLVSLPLIAASCKKRDENKSEMTGAITEENTNPKNDTPLNNNDNNMDSMSDSTTHSNSEQGDQPDNSENNGGTYAMPHTLEEAKRIQEEAERKQKKKKKQKRKKPRIWLRHLKGRNPQKKGMSTLLQGLIIMKRLKNLKNHHFKKSLSLAMKVLLHQYTIKTKSLDWPLVFVFWFMFYK
ncbi:variable surface lipoprotein [Mycoplasmopsis agalactiae]|uniref:variable surface lipoprotein n=1 Tax=Mycoplasmopsis agalactiae TaxID=2110 RepID=UPI002F43013B